MPNDRKRILRAIKREGRHIKDPHTRRVYLKAAVETGLVESNLSNPRGGDADSAGWRQERASLYANPTNISAAARRFRQEFQQHYDPGERSYQVAAQVQRPAAQYRGRYKERAGEAAAILRGQGMEGSAPNTQQGASYKTVPGVDRSQDRQALKLAYLEDSHNPDALLTLGLGLKGAQDTPDRRVKVKGPTSKSLDGASSGRVRIDPSADRAGVQTHRSVVRFVRQVSSIAGSPVRIGTGTNHSEMTVNGNVSDHWSGHAADIPATGRRLIRLGRAALIAAGMNPRKARRQTGGLFNVGGHQIIFNTHEGGDHTNHLHVSA